MQQLTTIANGIITLINGTLVPLLFAVAFIVFLFGVFRYFIAGGANEEKRREGRQLVIYSVIGFAVMITIWGIVNLVIGTFGAGNTKMPTLPTFNSTGTTDGTNTTNPNTTNTSPSNVTNTSNPATAPTQGFIGPQ